MDDKEICPDCQGDGCEVCEPWTAWQDLGGEG
jgi:hypothetical protein